METIYRILRYLKGAPGKGLLFSKNGGSNIKGYTDADWAGDQTTRKSTSGYFMWKVISYGRVRSRRLLHDQA